MADAVLARSAEEVRAAVAEAAGLGRPLEIVGRGSKRTVGRMADPGPVLDLSGLSGVVDYAPDELVIVVRPGTPLAEVESLLKANRQMFAFEPPTYARLLGDNRGASVGGMIATNLSGPRRFQSGAVRDHFLGFEGVSGKGVAFAAGSRVMKNVTGYDLPKLMAGSWGTLAVMTQVNLRTAPLPEAEETLLVLGLDEQGALARMTGALRSGAAVSGAAHLPADVARGLTVLPGAAQGASVTALRVEGTPASVAARRGMLEEAGGDRLVLDSDASARFWHEVREAAPLADPPDHAVWRLTVEPQLAPMIAANLRSRTGARVMTDWGGGLLTVSIAEDQAMSDPVTAAIPSGRGQAVLLRGSPALRRAVAPFTRMEPVLAALNARVKRSFDPAGVLNPGRMYEGL